MKNLRRGYKKSINKYYNDFKANFVFLKNIHQQKHQLLLAGEDVATQVYARVLSRDGNQLLKTGKSFLENGMFSDKQHYEIQEIMNNVKKLLEAEQPA